MLSTVITWFLSESRNHWILAVRAILIGLEVSYLAQILGHEFFYRFRDTLEPIISPYFAWIAVFVFCGSVSGWIVRALHRKHQSVMLLVYIFALFVWESIARF